MAGVAVLIGVMGGASSIATPVATRTASKKRKAVKTPATKRRVAKRRTSSAGDGGNSGAGDAEGDDDVDMAGADEVADDGGEPLAPLPALVRGGGVSIGTPRADEGLDADDAGAAQ